MAYSVLRPKAELCTVMHSVPRHVRTASKLLEMASNLTTMASASNLIAMASNLVAMAPNLVAMASNLTKSLLLCSLLVQSIKRTIGLPWLAGGLLPG